MRDVTGGAPTASEIVLTKNVDKASPALLSQLTSPTTGSVETLGERELDQVVGRAYDAYMALEGTKQGKFKGES